MAYLRYGSELTYVEGTSDNYVFYSSGNPNFMQDYGEKISDPGLADMMCSIIDTNDEYDATEKIYFMKKICERLNVKLRSGVEVAMKV